MSVAAGVPCQDVKQRLKKALSRNAYSDRQIERLYSEFRDGQRQSTDRCERSGRPVSSSTEENIELIEEMMQERRNWTEREIGGILGIAHSTVHQILIDHGYKKVKRDGFRMN